MLEFVDTHCHLHAEEYGFDQNQVLKNAKESGVTKIICIGTDPKDSTAAVKFAAEHEEVFASVGLIPHDAKQGQQSLDAIEGLISQPKVVAIGEIGLDFFYTHSPKKDQVKALNFQIGIALKHDLPIIFHVRDAYPEFWQIFDDFKGIKGVCHSFSATRKELDQILERGLYVGLNGIVTFSKNKKQIEAFKAAPLDKLLLETDAPYLTPAPFRGRINESMYVESIAKFLSDLRGEPLDKIARATTDNASKLFKI